MIKKNLICKDVGGETASRGKVRMVGGNKDGREVSGFGILITVKNHWCDLPEG